MKYQIWILEAKTWSLEFDELVAVVNHDHEQLMCNCAYCTHDFVCIM